MRDIRKLVDQAKFTLYRALRKSSKPLVAFSGGKDSIVVAHIAKDMGVKHYVCDVSFTFRKQRESIMQIAEMMGINVSYQSRLDMSWLKKNRHVLFSTSSKVRAWSFAQRQQRTVKLYAKEIGADLQIFGRRTEENSVRAPIYKTSAGLQCHPIRDWKEAEVWEYLKRERIPTPYIYTTKLGKVEGNTPFHSLHPKRWGGSVDNCWKAVEDMNDIYHRGIFDD